jgi:hypothetical protein
MNVYRGSRGIVPHILNFVTRRRSVVIVTRRPSCLRGKKPQQSLNRRLDRPHGRSWRFRRDKFIRHRSQCADWATPWTRPARRRVLVRKLNEQTTGLESSRHFTAVLTSPAAGPYTARGDAKFRKDAGRFALCTHHEVLQAEQRYSSKQNAHHPTVVMSSYSPTCWFCPGEWAADFLRVWGLVGRRPGHEG